MEDVSPSPGPSISCCGSHPLPPHHLLDPGTHSLTLAFGSSLLPLPAALPSLTGSLQTHSISVNGPFLKLSSVL